MSLKHLSHGIYRDPRTQNLYHRPTIGSRRTCRKLNASTLTMARRELAALKTRQLEARLGVALDPYAKLVTIGQLTKVWLERNCPDRKGVERAGESLESEKARVTRLLPFWKEHEARTITPEDCRDYHAWRTRQSKRYRLGRSVDAELTTLSNLLAWAVQNPRKTALTINPLTTNKPRFDNSALTRHCTAAMPMSDEALHQLATYLLGADRSRPLGWQLLLEALTGARTSEILTCRIDVTTPRQPGYQDNHALHLHRLKKGIEPWALLEAVKNHAPLADLLAAFRHWHAGRYPHCSWFIPGRTGKQPMDAHSLTNALRRACRELKMPFVTSHGLRAYFVRTLRSLGIDDSEIAKRLGHRSGVSLVEKTYGISEPGWFGSRKMDFLPAGISPAWAPWSPPKSKKIIRLPAYHTHTRSDKTGSIQPKRATIANGHKKPENIIKSTITKQTQRSRNQP